MPVDAPEITRRECVVTGAELYLVDGLIGDAGRLVARGGRRAATATRTPRRCKEPYRIEGKKTMGYEIAEQLGWRVPDVILYPTGGGVGIIAIHKALLEMRELGWVTGDLPRLVAVQATGCAPIVDAFDAGARREHRAGRPAHGRVRDHRAQGAGRLPRARRRPRHRRHRRRRHRRGAAGRRGRAGPRRGHLDLPRGRGLLRRRRAAARSRAGSTATRRSSCSTPAPG